MKHTQNTLNLSSLPILNEELVLQVLQNNYKNERFYTWGGKTLLAINPCANFGHLYTPEMIDHYYLSQNKNDEPHVYAVAENARHMLSSGLGKVNQSIIVSGESGAGKTYTTAHVLQFLTTVASASYFRTIKYHQPEKIQQQIIDSTPLLEAFGNASTSRNKNSSRFGKFIQLQYCGGQFAGAKISTYLLEKTRVATSAMQTERNYNIFYQLIAGSSVNERNEWMLDFQLAESLMADTTDADERKFLETKHAMNDIGLSIEEQKNVFQVLSAILHLKELKFKASLLDSCIIQIGETNAVNSQKASALLGINPSELKNALTIKTIVAGRTSRISVFSKPCSIVGECQARRDCLVKFLYDRLFEWLVSFINREVSAVNWDSFIGILDVYGFESFEYNSLEQLCINFANEKLQQYFVKDFLHDEQMLFVEEGIDFCLVDYTDNKHCLEVLEGRTRASVFGLLNEDCQLHWQNDPISVTKKLLETLKESYYVEALANNKGKPMNCPTEFVVRHYAGKVKYSTEEMIDKNKDNIPAEFISMLAHSSKSFISELSPLESGRLTPNKKTRKQTVLSKFKASLDNLVDVLNLCDAHYIRCLVPNVLCQPSSLDLHYLSSQLKACGILESIAICHTGLPVRMSYGSFVKHYSPLFGKNVKYLERLVRLMDERNASFESNEEKGSGSSVLQQACRDMIYNLLETTTQKNCQFGKTRLFLSSEMFHRLEKVLSEYHFRMATLIQCAWRRYSRIRTQKEKAAIIIQKEFRRWKTQRQYIHKKCAAVVIQRAYRCYRDRCLYRDDCSLKADVSDEHALPSCSQTGIDTYHSASDSEEISLVLSRSDEENLEQSMLQDNQCAVKNEEHLHPIKNCNKMYNNQTYNQWENILHRHHEPFPDNCLDVYSPSIRCELIGDGSILANSNNDCQDTFSITRKYNSCLTKANNENAEHKNNFDKVNPCFLDSCSFHSKGIQDDIYSTCKKSLSFGSENTKTVVNLSSNEILPHADIIEENIHNITNWTLNSSLKISGITNNLNDKVPEHKSVIQADSSRLIQNPTKQNETLCEEKVINKEFPEFQKATNHYKTEGIYSKASLRKTFNGKGFEKLLKFVPATRCKQQSRETSSFPGKPSISSSVYNKTAHLYSKDGLVSIRRMPTTKVRFHTRVTVLPYSHMPPLSEIQCSLTDALENEENCLLHKSTSNQKCSK